MQSTATTWYEESIFAFRSRTALQADPLDHGRLINFTLNFPVPDNQRHCGGTQRLLVIDLL